MGATRARGLAVCRAAATARARVAALGGALALALVGAGPAAAGTAPITACDTVITAPGTYVLVVDLTNCELDGIRVFASNVRLVLGDHTIAGDGALSQGVGVSVEPLFSSLPPLKNVRVEGGTVTDFSRGILVGDASGVRIDGVTVSGNIGIGAGVGVLVADASRVRISDVTASNNPNGGIELVRCTGCRVADSWVIDNGDDGIGVFSSPDAAVAGNATTGNAANGIRVDAATARAHLTRNVATGNGNVDLVDENPSSPCANIWRHNTFGTKSGAGAGCIR